MLASAILRAEDWLMIEKTLEPHGLFMGLLSPLGPSSAWMAVVYISDLAIAHLSRTAGIFSGTGGNAYGAGR